MAGDRLAGAQGGVSARRLNAKVDLYSTAFVEVERSRALKADELLSRICQSEAISSLLKKIRKAAVRHLKRSPFGERKQIQYMRRVA